MPATPAPAPDQLRFNLPIVDKDGNPTPQFQRQWQQVLASLDNAQKRLAAGGL